MNYIFYTVLIMVCSATVSSKAIFKVTLLRYEANEDRCCDGVNFFGTCNECDPYFKVCLRQRETGKETCTETSRENDKHSIDLTSSGISPRIFQLPLESLKETLNINVKTQDYDQANRDDDMDRLNYDFIGNSSSSPIRVTLLGEVPKYNTRLMIDISINCEQNYFGYKCTKFCKNNTRSFCDSNGSRFCLTGYTGRSCESEIPSSNQTILSIETISSTSVTQESTRTVSVKSSKPASNPGKSSLTISPISKSSTIGGTQPDKTADKMTPSTAETSTQTRPSISIQSVSLVRKVSPMTLSNSISSTQKTVKQDEMTSEKRPNQPSTEIPYTTSVHRITTSQNVSPKNMTTPIVVIQTRVTTEEMTSTESQSQPSIGVLHTDSMHSISPVTSYSHTDSIHNTPPVTSQSHTDSMHSTSPDPNVSPRNATASINITGPYVTTASISTDEPPTTTMKRLQVTDAVTVKCNEFGWDIRVDVGILKISNPTIKSSDIYLGKNLCHGDGDGKILSFKQGLRECLTSEIISGSQLIYRNELIYAVPDPDHPFIIRYYNWTVRVECDVYRNETATGHILHDAASNSSLQVAGETHYAVSMSFYKDSGYMMEIPGNPLHVHVGTLVYVKVYTIAPAFTVKMVVKNCYTKISENGSDATSFYLIKNGCEKDINTHIISQTGHEMKFVFEDFQYTSSQDGHYLFCDAVFCSASDTSAQCQQRCETKKKRNVAVNSLRAASVSRHILN